VIRRLLAFSLLLTGVLAAAPSAQAAVRGPLVPENGTLVGAYVNYKNAHGRAGRMQQIMRVEHKMGRRYDIDHTYAQWRTPFPTWYEKWDVEIGRIPFVNWKGVPSRSIANGSQDRVLKARARAVKALGAPIMIQYYGEMDRQAGKPGAFVKAWRHIVKVFNAQGATNAVWVWCPTADGFRTGRAQKYYPGNRYADWLCADAYNWPGKSWRSFRSAVRPFYSWAKVAHARKPLMIGEFGSREGSHGRKGRWIKAMQRDLKTRLRHIKAVVYFDTVAGDSGIDWRLRSSRSSMRAWVRMARDPWFSHHGTITGSRPHRAHPSRHTRPAPRRHVRPATRHTQRTVLRATRLHLTRAHSTVTSRHGVDLRFHVSRSARVNLRVLDRSGDVVRVLHLGKERRGQGHTASWWGWSQKGKPVARGRYSLQLVLRRHGARVLTAPVTVAVRAATHAR
jgi:hypothetical protein